MCVCGLKDKVKYLSLAKLAQIVLYHLPPLANSVERTRETSHWGWELLKVPFFSRHKQLQRHKMVHLSGCSYLL